MKYPLHFFLITLLPLSIKAQPNIEWARTYGGNHYDSPNCIQPTSDGGYIAVGRTESDDGDVSLNYGNRDAWVIKMDAAGTVQWQKSFGGSDFDSALSIEQMDDGGYILAGYSNSNNGDVSGRHGTSYDVWIFKISGTGILEWQKMYGGTGYDSATSLVKSNDGGFVVTGYTNSNDGDISGNHGSYDCFIAKFNAAGILQWQQIAGGSKYDDAYAITATADGGYIVAGDLSSDNAGTPAFHGYYDSWVIKLDQAGNIQWQKAFGGTDSDLGYSIVQANDGGYVLAGSTFSTDGDLNSIHTSYQEDGWIIKLSAIGDIEWSTALGGSLFTYIYGIIQDSDGGYIAAGATDSYQGDVISQHGGYDAWIVKLNASGAVVWQKSVGGGDDEEGRFIHATNDGGFILANNTFSTNGDVTGNHGDIDIWIVKFSATVGTTEPSLNDLQLYPNPARHDMFLNLPEDERAVTINVIDLLGHSLPFTPKSDQRTIDISALPEGCYWARVTTQSGKLYSGKFIKLN